MLATEATALVHGRDKADAAAETARKTFEQGALAAGPAERRGADAQTRGAASACLRPSCRPGLVKSNGEARRQIKGGGLKVNDEPVVDEKALLDARATSHRWRHQAVARQEEARAAEARLSAPLRYRFFPSRWSATTTHR